MIRKSEIQATETDLYFYTHEVREAQLMQGKAYNTTNYDSAHAQASKEYGVTIEMEKADVFYTPEASQAYDAQLCKALFKG